MSLVTRHFDITPLEVYFEYYFEGIYNLIVFNNKHQIKEWEKWNI